MYFNRYFFKALKILHLKQTQFSAQGHSGHGIIIDYKYLLFIIIDIRHGIILRSMIILQMI